MEATVDAIVIRRRDAGESDRRLTLLSEEFGKIDVVAKGARNSASRLKGVSEPLSVATFTFHDGKKQRFVTQAQPKSSFRGLRSDYDRLTMGLAFAELMSAILPYEQPLPELYELLLVVLGILEVHQKPVAALAWAEIKLLELSGFQPSFGFSVVSEVVVQESEPFVSPRAGGYVTYEESADFSDRFQTTAQVLYGLHALSDLEAPPRSLKFAVESLQVLLGFWRVYGEASLPANESLLKHLNENQALKSD